MTGIMPIIGQLNNNVAGLSGPGLRGVDLTYNNTRCVSALVMKHLWVSVLWIWCKLPPLHCFGGSMGMILLAMCSGFCRILWISLKHSCHLHLTLSPWVNHTPNIPYIVIISCLAINVLSFWWLGTCDNLQCLDSVYCTERTHLF